MVKKLFIGLTALALLAIGIFGAIHLLQSEKSRIRDRFSQAASIMNKDEEEKPITMLALVPSLQKLFADPCKLDFPSRSISGSYSPRELAQLALRWRKRFETLSLSFHDPDITLQDSKTADAVFTILVRGTRDGREFQEAREVEAILRKQEGRWVFARARVIQVLRK